MRIQTHSPRQTKSEGARLGTEIAHIQKKAHRKRAYIVTLTGELGGGKTTFTKGLLGVFGVKKQTTSPTFTIAKHFTVKKNTITDIYHLDWYRLKNKKELTAIGWDEMVKNPTALIIVEWPEKIAKALKRPDRTVRFLHTKKETERIIEM